MVGVSDRRRTIVWVSPERVWLVREVAEAIGLEVVAAGGPGKGRSAAAASALGADPIDDLTQALAEGEADLIWLVCAGSFGAGAEGRDASACQAARRRGVRIATLEPIPPGLMELDSGRWLALGEGGRAVDAPRFCPLARLARPLRESPELIQTFGAVDCLAVEVLCAPREGTAGARLYSAAELVCAVMGEPEVVDAAYVSPGRSESLHVLPGQSLADLHGTITANLRFADGRCAGLIASDRGGQWHRQATLLGPGGRLRITDGGFRWVGPEGNLIDQSEARRGEPDVAGSLAVRVIADAINCLMDPRGPEVGPVDHVGILSICQAALLSARTGQGESPATIRRMTGGR